VKIDIPRVLLHLRARAVEARGRTPERALMRTLGWVFRDAGRFARAQRLLRPLARGRPIRRLPPPLDAWTRTRDLKPPARETFRSWWRSR
jgi:L-lactate dehydrogenase complex protein LldF